MKKIIKTVKYYDDGSYDEIVHHVTGTNSYYTTCPTCYFTTYRESRCYNVNCPSNRYSGTPYYWQWPYLYSVNSPYYTGVKD